MSQHNDNNTINKVVYAGVTLIDLTNDTVTPSDLQIGVTAHASDGTIITGTGIDGDYQNLDLVSY